MTGTRTMAPASRWLSFKRGLWSLAAKRVAGLARRDPRIPIHWVLTPRTGGEMAALLMSRRTRRSWWPRRSWFGTTSPTFRTKEAAMGAGKIDEPGAL